MTGEMQPIHLALHSPRAWNKKGIYVCQPTLSSNIFLLIKKTYEFKVVGMIIPTLNGLTGIIVAPEQEQLAGTAKF
jgi:hypothetical protein